MTRTSLGIFRDWLYEQKFRFDRGQQFMVFINFSLLVITTSKVLGFSGWLVLILVPVAFVSVWAFGWFVIEVTRGVEKEEREFLKRSWGWKKHEENFRKIDEVLEIIRGLNVGPGDISKALGGVEVQHDGKILSLQERASKDGKRPQDIRNA